MGRRRRRVMVPAIVFAILAFILGWEGLGLFPSEPGEDTVGEESGAEVPEPEAGEDAGERDLGASLAGGSGTKAEGAEGAGEETGAGKDAAGAEDAELPPDADRLLALQELIRESVATGRLGDGFRALQALEDLKDVDSWLEVRKEVRQALGDALTTMVLDLRDTLQRGEVLRAKILLDALRGTPHARVLQAVNTMAAAEGWPSLGEGVVEEEGLGAPLLLDRERQVLVEWQDELVVAEVAECQPDEVTVRLRQPDGVVFPTVPRCQVEPIAATGEEALNQGLVALRAGDRELAWLWLCRAQVAGGGAADLARELGRLVGRG